MSKGIPLAFKFKHQFFPVFRLELKHQPFLGPEPAGLQTRTVSSPLLGLQLADYSLCNHMIYQHMIFPIVYVYIHTSSWLYFSGEPWLMQDPNPKSNTISSSLSALAETSSLGIWRKMVRVQMYWVNISSLETVLGNNCMQWKCLVHIKMFMRTLCFPSWPQWSPQGWAHGQARSISINEIIFRRFCKNWFKKKKKKSLLFLLRRSLSLRLLAATLSPWGRRPAWESKAQNKVLEPLMPQARELP